LRPLEGGIGGLVLTLAPGCTLPSAVTRMLRTCSCLASFGNIADVLGAVSEVRALGTEVCAAAGIAATAPIRANAAMVVREVILALLMIESPSASVTYGCVALLPSSAPRGCAMVADSTT
jgi:hypothetical protein